MPTLNSVYDWIYLDCKDPQYEYQLEKHDTGSLYRTWWTAHDDILMRGYSVADGRIKIEQILFNVNTVFNAKLDIWHWTSEVYLTVTWCAQHLLPVVSISSLWWPRSATFPVSWSAASMSVPVSFVSVSGAWPAAGRGPTSLPPLRTCRPRSCLLLLLLL